MQAASLLWSHSGFAKHAMSYCDVVGKIYGVQRAVYTWVVSPKYMHEDTPLENGFLQCYRMGVLQHTELASISS